MLVINSFRLRYCEGDAGSVSGQNPPRAVEMGSFLYMICGNGQSTWPGQMPFGSLKSTGLRSVLRSVMDAWA